MTESEIDKCRKRLERFLADLLEPLGRRERRQWSGVYVRGLLLDGERKSIEPMAARLPDGNVQALQQLIGQSPWPWAPVWERLAQRMTDELTPERVWVIDDTGFPKQGQHSVGVARQYSGTLGKTANCQVAVSLHQTSGEASTILGWRLYLPESWTQDPARRDAAGIPQEVKFQTKWQLALDLIDAARVWGLSCGVVLADAGYGETTEFREVLETRQLRYAVGQSFPNRLPRPRTLPDQLLHRLHIPFGQTRRHGFDGFAFAIQQQAAHVHRTPAASLAPPQGLQQVGQELFQTLSAFLDFALGHGPELSTS